MNVGISTASFFPRCELEETPVLLKSVGVNCCEVFLNTGSEYEEGYAGLLRRRMDDCGQKVISVHALTTQFEPQLFASHTRQRSDAVAVFRRVLRAAEILGADYYVMHGASYRGWDSRNLVPERSAPLFCEYTGMAREHGVVLTLENVSWCMFNSPQYGAELVRRTGADGIKFTLDVKQAMRSGYDAMDYIEAVGESIVHWHLCDYMKGSTEVLKLPGYGDCDFAAQKAALEARGYRGSAIIEVYGDNYGSYEELAACVQRLNTIFNPQ